VEFVESVVGLVQGCGESHSRVEERWRRRMGFYYKSSVYLFVLNKLCVFDLFECI